MRKSVKTSGLALLCLALALAGCSGGNNNKGNGASAEPSGSAAAGNGDIAAPAGGFPIVAEKTTLKVMVMGDANVESFEDNEFTRWYEEKTNVHVEWEVVPPSNALDKLNLTLTSGNLPDVIMNFNVPAAQQAIYGQEGVFVELTDLIEKYGTETKKMFASDPLIKQIATAPDGKIYALPYVSDCYHCTVIQKLWIYTPWLEKLGLDMPTTTEEFHNVLKAFKEQDPNGNGKADEIPFAGSIATPGNNIDNFVMNAFIYDNITHDNFGLLLKDGKIDAAFNKPEWKEGLLYLHQLYADGLIAPESLTMDNSQLKQLGENPGVPLLGVVSGLHMGNFTQFYGESGRWLEYKAIPPLKGPQGVQIASNTPYTAVSGRYIITNAAKHPDVAMRWADAFYTQEVLLNGKYGREGIEWSKADADQMGIDGKPALFQALTPTSGAQKIHWYNSFPMNETNEFRLGWAVTDPDSVEPILYAETQKYEAFKNPNEDVIPPLYFTTEQSNEIANLKSTIDGQVREMNARFILGDAKLDSEWDAYVERLNSMNLKRMLEIYQEAYDTMKRNQAG